MRNEKKIGVDGRDCVNGPHQVAELGARISNAETAEAAAARANTRRASMVGVVQGEGGARERREALVRYLPLAGHVSRSLFDELP